MNPPTIAAICTPRGFGGVGIVKISGPDAISIARQLFRSKPGRTAPFKNALDPESSFKNNLLRYGVVVNNTDGQRIDEVLLSAMRGPQTYTGEDVVEINAHAGPTVLNMILDAVVQQGAVLAQPGEFTRRAFLNGRIDLTQAEAVIDLINAKTCASAGLANSQMAGILREEIERISDIVQTIIAHNEAHIDFPDDMETNAAGQAEREVLGAGVVEPLKKILVRFKEGKILRDGLRLAVVGRPNVGKSSLMNRLVGTDRAIVTDLPGTTRDAVEDYINIKGVPVVVVDTAGLQNTENPVEIIGIEKTLENIENADLILFVVEEGRGIRFEDHAIFQKVENRNVIIVVNKTDLEGPREKTRIPDTWEKFRHVRTSALKGDGLDRLENEIYSFVTGGQVETFGSDPAPNLRQKALIEKSIKAAEAAIEGKKREDPPELTAIELKDCLTGLEEILGKNMKDDVLGRIFRDFCIGK